MVNGTEISAETFYRDIILQIQKIQAKTENLQSDESQSEFSNYPTLVENEGQAVIVKKARKKSKFSKKKKFQDDEDLDFESSGDKGLTTVYPVTDSASDLNDTTIVFDQEEQDE